MKRIFCKTIVSGCVPEINKLDPKNHELVVHSKVAQETQYIQILINIVVLVEPYNLKRKCKYIWIKNVLAYKLDVIIRHLLNSL